MSKSKSLAARAGFSIIGLLVSMACIAVLFAILMTSLNKAVTGQGSQQAGTVRSFEDKMYLVAIYQSMLVHANDNKGVYIVPSDVSGSRDITQNTTANLFSAMVMQGYTPPHQLISGNEYSGYVDEKMDYNFGAYSTAKKVYWDQTFQADLKNLSNVSFAHMPLFGERFDREWRSTMSSLTPLIGNRGPKDGVNDPNSFACGRDGVWRGHIAFGDGHIDFVETPTPAILSQKPGEKGAPDNIFKMESGPNGADVILGFTRTMSKKGPELQFD